MINDQPGSIASAERSDGLKYVIITPAWNEAAFVELTLKSMVEQTVHPVKWVIVSDGSTDGTDEIVQKYADAYDWIELVRMPKRSERHFAGKVYAFNAGQERVTGLEYDIIGNVDADISFGPDLFEFLLLKFAEDPSLGVAGTDYVEEAFAGYNYNIVNIEDVTGHCQLFRRRCFKEIGGYLPIKCGGIDSVAVITARMKGWKTRTYTERTCVHHRKVGGAQGSGSMAAFKAGQKDYHGGSHPVWVIFRGLYHLKNKPYILGGISMVSGYLSGVLTRAERQISPELVVFRRNEQMQRLKRILKNLCSFTGKSKVEVASG